MMTTERTIDIRVPISWLTEELAERVKTLTPIDRHRAMVERLGEACRVETAAHEIECSTRTIYRLLEAGKLKSACDGSRVDVRSLTDYIESKG